MVEEKMNMKRRRRREEEIIEAALAAAGAALAISAIKNLLIPSLLNQLPLLSSLDPPPFLFLLLNLIIASIVIASIDSIQPTDQRDKKKRRRKESVSFSDRLDCVEEKEEREGEGEEEGDAEELNRRVEAFIMAFRHQLRVDSFSSHVHGSNAAAA